MPKFTHKIEDLLDSVAKSVHFNPQSPPASLNSSSSRISYPQLLDFSFPQSDPQTNVSQVGEVIYVGDGICHISGLNTAKIDDIININTHKGVEKALILGIHEDRVEAVVLGDYSHIKRGHPAKATNSKLRIPVGKSILGRVINPLGIPLDGQGAVDQRHLRDVEFPAPGVVDRVPITHPLHTGILTIDATIPIGRGQRELVIGDRKTGKSRTMLDIISNQSGRNVFCIYVGVGIQAAKAKATLELLQQRQAMKYTTMVLALSDDPPSIQYIAPYVGAALGEYFMYSGKDALVVYDDLSKQAKAYRQVSLLLKRSPGRDAYPGDIFFLHSRLLERASQLSPKFGGGSLTALPIAETQSGDVSDYIITNLMSITDGHIYLDNNMMHEGLLPPINSGTSVSRIGGKVQSRLLQKVGELSGRTLARYEEVKSFETINTAVTVETMRDIKRGKRLRELLSQDSDISFSLDEAIVFLAIAVSARMDHFETEHVDVFKKLFLPFYRQLSLEELSKSLHQQSSLEAIDPLLDRLFNRFCRHANLPLIPSSSGSQ